MTALLAPVTANPQAPLARRNPAAKLGAAVLLMLAPLLSVDAVTPGVVLAAVACALPFTGVSPRALITRTWPLLIAVVSLGAANAVFTARQGGRVLIDAGPVLVTTDGVAVGAAAAVRVLAIALPGVLAVATTEPVDLADSLVQQLRVPARFAYGALAAWRLAPLLAVEWATITRARRARGMDAGHNPLVAMRLLGSKVFALLVAAIRRGTRLAAAMDARGFDSAGPRSSAREQRLGPADGCLLAAAAGIACAAAALSVAAGTWQPLVS